MTMSSKLYLGIFIILAFCVWETAAAEFTMNFQPVLPADSSFGTDGISVRCNRPEGPNVGCTYSYGNTSDPTPFLQERFTSGGATYYHVIVGLPGNGFAQETYIKATGASYSENGPGSASLGDGNCRYGFGYSISNCNISDPLGQSHDNTFTGDGSGDPRQVTMRQVMGGTWDGGTNTWSCGASDAFCLEFAKNLYLYKPKIEMTINDPAYHMQAHFAFDMSNSTYTNDSLAGSMINTVQFTDPFAGDAGNFDFAVDATPGWANLTGGRYKFTGSGPRNASTEPYSYVGGTFNLDRPWWMYKY